MSETVRGKINIREWSKKIKDDERIERKRRKIKIKISIRLKS